MHIQINCAVDSGEAARTAIEAGADWITLTPPALPRHAPHVALAEWFDGMCDALAYARKRRVRAACALPMRVAPERLERHEIFVTALSKVGLDALVACDLGLLEHARRSAPGLELHLAPQAALANAESLAFYAKRFGIRRACLANTLDLDAAIRIARSGHAEVEVFGYGAAGAMLEGLCSLSAFFAGHSATREGACAPSGAASVECSSRFRSTRLNGLLVDSAPLEVTLSHPSVCTGRYRIAGRSTHLFGGRNGSATLKRLPDLMLAGVRCVRLAPCGLSHEATGRMVAMWREAIAHCRHDPSAFEVRPEWRLALAGSQTALPCTVSVTAHR